MSSRAASSRTRRARRTRFAIIGALLTCLIIPAAYAMWPYAAGYQSMTSVTQHKAPAINMPAARESSANTVQPSPSTAFPHIDWDALAMQNPDVIAWVTVPGTSIDYAVVRASADNPQFYLTHDINGNASPYGCPYLDADVAAQGGIDAPFPVIYGHHLINGLMFSDFAKFSDADYAAEHRQILLMTPDGNVELEVFAVNVVDANAEGIQVAFDSPDDLTRYIKNKVRESEAVLASEPEDPWERVFCFVTCSYGSSNERTLVYATKRDA